MKRFDCVISGAGMVGAVTALEMVQAGRSVLLLDHQKQPEFSADQPPHLRVSAIANNQLQRFEQLGIMDRMVHERMGFYRHMSVWDNASTGTLDFSSQGSQPLGVMIENQHILGVVHQMLADHPQAELWFDSQIDGFEQTDRKVSLTVTKAGDSEAVSVVLLLVAEGARSPMRQRLGIEVSSKTYAQHGLVAYLNLPDAPKETALQAFNPNGPVGLLPMNNGLFSMVWSLPDQEAKHWCQAEEAAFIAALGAHINRDFGAIKLCSQRAMFPLHQMYADRYFEGRVVVLGDAAHTVHPLAGQGANLGLADAALLMTLLQTWDWKAAEDLQRLLKKYQRQRRGEVTKTSETMHALHHLFTKQSMPLNFLRGWGMQRLNQFEPLKQWLLKQAGS